MSAMRKLIHGEKLAYDILNYEITRKAIVDELIYERDIFMLSSDSGAGKSIFSLNLAACLSFPTGKTFMGCKISGPKKVLYIQLEGDYEESIERLREMGKGGMILDENNICIVEEKLLNVADESSVNSFFKDLNAINFIPEVIIIDPIYKLCHGDISKGEFALAVIRFSDKLYNKFNCTNILIHHNTKDSYGSDGKKIQKDDAFYGHSFIKNHIRTSYAMKIAGENKRQLIRKKGRGSDTLKGLNLDYDPETYILSVDNEGKKRIGDAFSRLSQFCAELKKKARHTTASEIINECEVSYARLRQLKESKEVRELFTIQKMPPNNKEFWIPK